MDVICAWCQVVIAHSDEPCSMPVSHGLCASCLEAIFGEDTSLRHFLNQIDAPVLVVDQDVVVVTANDLACAATGRSLDEVRGLRGGDAFACAYARLPGGCGRTVHCRTCTIRMSVERTFATGQACVRVPAYLDQASAQTPQPIAFRISSELVGNVVLLRIEPEPTTSSERVHEDALV